MTNFFSFSLATFHRSSLLHGFVIKNWTSFPRESQVRMGMGLGIQWGRRDSDDNTGNPFHDKCVTLSWRPGGWVLREVPPTSFPAALLYDPAGSEILEIPSMAARDLAKQESINVAKRARHWHWGRAKQIEGAGAALPGLEGLAAFPSTCRHNFGILMRNPYLCCLFCQKKKKLAKKGMFQAGSICGEKWNYFPGWVC